MNPEHHHHEGTQVSEPVAPAADKKSGLAYWAGRVLEECDKASQDFAADPVHDLRVAIRSELRPANQSRRLPTRSPALPTGPGASSKNATRPARISRPIRYTICAWPSAAAAPWPTDFFLSIPIPPGGR